MDKDFFRIEWNLREFGPKPAYDTSQPPHAAPSPRLAFARALAVGDIPANAPRLDDEEKAA
jgi:hypothetical protein